MKNNRDERFGEGYFNGDKEEHGVFKSYQFEDFYPPFKALAISIKSLFNPTKVLDVGCAKGFLVKAFKDVGVAAWGVDVSEYAISNAPKDIQSRLYKVDLNRDILPFENGYFDFVTFLGTIEYLDNHKHIINEIERVLKGGGGLYLTTIYKREPGDKIRINIHTKRHWIKEFGSSGFKFDPRGSDLIIRGKFKNMFSFSRPKETIKFFKVAKILCQKGGYVGENIVLLAYKLLTSYGILYFTKGDEK